MFSTPHSWSKTWEYSISSFYSILVLSLVNAIKTERIFFFPLSESPLIDFIYLKIQPGHWTNLGFSHQLVRVAVTQPFYDSLDSGTQLLRIGVSSVEHRYWQWVNRKENGQLTSLLQWKMVQLFQNVVSKAVGEEAMCEPPADSVPLHCKLLSHSIIWSLNGI